jgi:hypothetical protein
MPSDIVTIAEFLPNEKAKVYFYKSLFESEGIYCIAVGELDAPTIGNIQLQVAARDAERARELLAEEAGEI